MSYNVIETSFQNFMKARSSALITPEEITAMRYIWFCSAFSLVDFCAQLTTKADEKSFSEVMDSIEEEVRAWHASEKALKQ